MKSSNLQQDKKTLNCNEPYASDEDLAYDDSVESSNENDSDSQVIDTRIQKTPPATQEPLLPKQESTANNNNNTGSVPSFHIQKSLNVNAAFAKIMFDVVKKGDIEAVKSQENRIGLDI